MLKENHKDGQFRSSKCARIRWEVYCHHYGNYVISRSVLIKWLFLIVPKMNINCPLTQVWSQDRLETSSWLITNILPPRHSHKLPNHSSPNLNAYPKLKRDRTHAARSWREEANYHPAWIWTNPGPNRDISRSKKCVNYTRRHSAVTLRNALFIKFIEPNKLENHK